VQHWRAGSDAILTGAATVRADNPRMTVRLPGAKRQPLRVIADSRFDIDRDSRVLDPCDSALVVGCEPGQGKENLEALGVECRLLGADGRGRVDLQALLEALAQRGINEVQVEAGGTLCGALLSQGLVDEVLIYQAPCLLGIDAPPAFAFGPLESVAQGVHLEVLESIRLGPDWRIRLRPARVDRS